MFAFSEVKLGLVPGVISPFVLAKIGTVAARRYFVTGERFDAGDGAADRARPRARRRLDAAVERVVGELLTAGPEAARVAKTLARAPLAVEETARLIAERRASAEGQEGLRAFLAAGGRAAPGSRRGARRRRRVVTPR